MNNTMDFGSRKFLSLLTASTFSVVISVIIAITQVIIVGQICGEAGISAVNLLLPVYNLEGFFAVLISIGSTIRYSEEMGRYNKKEAEKYFGQCIILSVTLGVIMMFLSIILKDLFFDKVIPSGEIFAAAAEYYRFFPFILLLSPIVNSLAVFVYIDGDTKICNLSHVFRIIGSIGGSILLGTKIGISGISLAMLIVLFSTTVILLTHMLNKRNSLKFVWHLSLHSIIRISKYGITDGISILCSVVLVFVSNAVVLAQFGSNYLAVLAIVINFFAVFSIFDGVGQAFSPLVNVCLGEKNYYDIHSIMRTATITAVLESVVLGIVLFVFSDKLPYIFGVDNALTAQYASEAIRIVVAGAIFTSLGFLFTSYYMLVNKIRFSCIITVLRGLVLPLAIGLPLMKIIGVKGLWIGFAAGSFMAIVICALIVALNRKTLSFPFLLPKVDNTFSNTFVLTNENISYVTNELDKFFAKRNISKKVANRVELTLEEMCTAISEKNPNKKVHVQSTVIIDENIRLLIRDDGEIMDVTSLPVEKQSVNSVFLTALMKQHTDKQNLAAIGFNRNELSFSIHD